MASVEKRNRDGKVTWLARWRDPDGRQRKRSFPRKLDADRFMVGIESDKLRGSYIDPDHARVPLREYVEKRWFPAQVHLRPNTRDLYRSRLDNHLLPAFGSRPLGSLRRQDFKTFVAMLSAKLAPARSGPCSRWPAR